MAKRKGYGEFTVGGMDDIFNRLEKCGMNISDIVANAVFVGAGTMADCIKEEAAKIKTEPWRWADENNPRLPSPQEKGKLTQLPIFGVSHHSLLGGDRVAFIGLGNRTGYTELRGQRRPVAVIVRSIESGTSFMKKQPFFRTAVRKHKQQILEQMKNNIANKVGDILEGDK